MSEHAPKIKAQLEAEGISIREWAESNGFKPRTFYAVIRGEVKAKRGVGHRISVQLGIKARPLGVQKLT